MRKLVVLAAALFSVGALVLSVSPAHAYVVSNGGSGAITTDTPSGDDPGPMVTVHNYGVHVYDSENEFLKAHYTYYLHVDYYDGDYARIGGNAPGVYVEAGDVWTDYVHFDGSSWQYMPGSTDELCSIRDLCDYVGIPWHYAYMVTGYFNVELWSYDVEHDALLERLDATGPYYMTSTGYKLLPQ